MAANTRMGQGLSSCERPWKRATTVPSSPSRRRRRGRCGRGGAARRASATSTAPPAAGARKSIDAAAATAGRPVAVARVGEGGVGEGEHEAAVAHAEPVEHRRRHGHPQRRPSRTDVDHLDAQRLRGRVTYRHPGRRTGHSSARRLGRPSPDLVDDRGVGERRRVAEVAALGDVAEQPAHDLAAARLGQVRRQVDRLRLGDGADLRRRRGRAASPRRPRRRHAA